MIFIFTLPQSDWNVYQILEMHLNTLKLTFALPHIQNVHFTSKCLPGWNSPVRKIIRSNLHQSSWPRDENGRQYLSDDMRSVRHFVNECPPNRKVTTATIRSCRSRVCITSSAAHTCHSSNSPQVRPNCTDSLHRLRLPNDSLFYFNLLSYLLRDDKILTNYFVISPIWTLSTNISNNIW